MRLRRTATAIGVTALIVSAGAGPVAASQPAPYGGLNPGVRYVASESDVQRVEFFVVDERDDGGALLAVSVDVQCETADGPIDGNNVLRGKVDADGRITAKGRVSSTEIEDLVTSGPARISGQLGSDGAVTGTVDVELTSEDLGTSCEAEQPWRSAPVADPGVARILGRVPVPRSIAERHQALAATEDALYPVTGRGDDQPRLHRVDPATGDIEWTTELGGAGLGVVVGGGLVWVANGGADESVVDGYDPDDGKKVAEIPGYAIAFGSDGVGWSIDGDSRLHRIEGRRPAVAETFEIPRERLSAVAAGTDGVYVASSADDGFDAAIERIDPESGEIVATAPDQLGGESLLVSDGSVWVAGFDGTQQLDAGTLETLGVNEAATALYEVAAPPGVWLADTDVADEEATPVRRVLVLDAQFATAFTVPWLTGPVASAGGSVWVLDPVLGIVQIEGG